jgi:hypothetical protein
MANFGNSLIVISLSWTQLKTILFDKGLSLQYDNTDSTYYQLFAIDVPSIVYVATVWTGSVPQGIIDGGYSQAQNNQDLADFQNNFKTNANMPVTPYTKGDNRWIYRLGNLTSTSSIEQLVAVNGYYEPAAQAQRGVKSTSAQDAPGGSGAAAVRIYFLDSNYIPHQEDLTLNGTTVVPTVNTNIRFIERFEVTRGTAAVGRIFLCTGSNGLGEICSIGAGATDAFLCHHYIPSGSQAQTIEWDVTANQSVSMRLKGQQWVSGNLVDPVYYDLENVIMTSGSTYNFVRTFRSNPAQEKTRVYITAQPQQISAVGTTIRTRLNIWQDYLYVSGST